MFTETVSWSKFNCREERVFKYRLSRVRRIVGNAFGIATSRFRIFRRPISAHVDTATAVTKAIIALHNFLIKELEHKSDYDYFTKEIADRETDPTVCFSIHNFSGKVVIIYSWDMA